MAAPNEDYQLQSSMKGKDLTGGINVMPSGMGEALKKRTSGEFKSERSGSSLTFSQTSSNQKSETIDSADSGSQKVNFKQMDKQMLSSNAVSTKKTTAVSGVASHSSSMSQNAMSSASSQISSSSMSSSSMSSQKMTSNKSSKTEFSSSFMGKEVQQQAAYEAPNLMMANSQQPSLGIANNVQHQMMANSQQPSLGNANNIQHQMMAFDQQQHMGATNQHGEEIGNEKIKFQIQSSIAELENEIGPDYGNQIKSPTPIKTDLFSPPPLERISEPPEHVGSKKDIFALPSMETPLSNGHALFNSKEHKAVNMELQQIQEETRMTSSKMNGTYEESSQCIQESSSSSSMLEKIMTPAAQDYDSGSLKRRDPRKMFTDSSFYCADHHPTMADQAENSFRLTSAFFNEDNMSSKGQQMFLNRAKRSGETIDDEVSAPRHDKVPNLKLVMNPEGKVQEWSDIAGDDLPNEQAIAAHANATVPSPDTDTGAGKGGELFAKRRKKAEDWVVDESTVGQDKPSNFADKFMHKQTTQQQQFQQSQQAEQDQKHLINQQQQQQQQEVSFRNQQESQQQFQQQSTSKQTQSLEIRRQQELQQATMNQQQLDLPANFQHCTLINRSNTPSFDTSCHNVQGINVWANTAPRGWAGSEAKHRVVGQGTMQLNNSAGPPMVAVCPATPLMNGGRNQQEEQLLIEQQQMEQQKMEQQQMEQQRMEQQHMEQQRMEQQRMEQQRMEQQRMEQQAMEQQRMEQKRMEQQQMEQQQMEQQRMEQQRMEQQQMEHQRMEQQHMEQQRMEQQRMEQQRMEQQAMEQQRMEQQRMEQQRMEQQRMEQQVMEQQRMEQQRMEQQRMEQQRMEQQRMEQQAMEQQRMEQQRMENQRMEQQQMKQQAMEQQRMEQQRMEQQKMEQQRMEQQRMEQQRMEQQKIEQQQQQMALQQQQQIAMQQQQQQSHSTKMSSTTSSFESSKTMMGANQADLEPEKRREYEAWFKNQEKEALEYSACVQYQEKGSDSKEMTTTTTTTSTQKHFQQQEKQQQLVQTNQMQGDFQSLGMTETPSIQSREMQLAKPPLPSTQQNQFNSMSQKSTQSFATREVAKGKEYTRAADEAGYTSSLHPTTTGDNIRQGGDAVFTQARSQSTERKDIRESGVFGGIGGDNNSLVDDTDYQKISVKNLVGHFSQVKPRKDISAQILPQQHNIGTGAAPSLNYLSMEQNQSQKQEFKKQESHASYSESSKTMQQQQSSTSVSSYQSQQVQQQSSVVQQNTENQEQNSASTVRRQSLKDYLLMDPATEHMKAGIIDPSAILRDSDATNGRSASEGILRQSSIKGSSDILTNKWDNHNAIARGWGGMKEKYHPVTFREIYNVDSQAPGTSHNL